MASNMKNQKVYFGFCILGRLQINKIIFNMNIIEKHNQQLFQGWGNENDINKDQLILTDILKRKTIMGSLPPLTDLKMRNSSYQHTQSQVKLQPARIKHLFNKQQVTRGIRQKTEGFKELNRDSISPLKKKLQEILNEQQQTKNIPDPIIEQSALQNISQFTFHKKQQSNSNLKSNLTQNQRKFKATSILKKIKNNQSFGNGMKKTQSKMYMKLNALQMIDDFKKNIFREASSIQNLTAKNRLMQQNNLDSKTKSYRNIFSMKHQIQEKKEIVDEKLKKTFFKFDVFEKEKRKKKLKFQRLDLMTQFNERILYNNSPLKLVQRSQTKHASPPRTNSKGMANCQDLFNPIKISKQKSPHRYKLTIN